MPEPVAIIVTEPSQVGEARRAALTLASTLGFDEIASGKVALVVTEAASNLTKHASEGLLLLSPLIQHQEVGLTILSLDRGPGMTDLSKCLRDGFSTAASPGTGLEQSWLIPFLGFLLPATPGNCHGRSHMGGAANSLSCPDIAGICVPKPGETISGDCWSVRRERESLSLMIADGLGHGPDAARAARAAARTFEETSHLGTIGFLQAAHLALRGSRGAAVAMAHVDLQSREVHFAGLGNISGVIIADGINRSMVSHNGIVGHEARKFQEFTYPFPPRAQLVMHSDGLATRWNLDAYPGLMQRDPALLAGVLYRDFQRGRDDTTVLVAREGRGAERL